MSIMKRLFGRRNLVVISEPSDNLPTLPYPESFANSVAAIRKGKDVPTTGRHATHRVFKSSAGVIIKPGPPDTAEDSAE